MIRHAVIAAVATAAFVLAFQLARGVRSNSPRSSEPAGSIAPTPRSAEGGTAGGRQSLVALAPPVPLPVVRVTRRAPTPYEQLVLSTPARFFAMKMPLQDQLVADKHLARDCFVDEDLVGATSLEFSWWVDSTPKHAKASGLRFIEVHDGVALPARVIPCIERALGGTYEALPERIPFPEFSGELPIRLSWRFVPTQPVRDESPEPRP